MTKYLLRISQGLCGHCGKPNDNGQSDCDKCLKHRRQYQTERYRKLQAQHRCGHCGTQMPKDWYFVLCSECRVKQNAFLRRIYAERKRNTMPQVREQVD